MAWIMDTYSMKVGYACPEIVTGKPIEIGGCVGRREATGRGVVFFIYEALKELGIAPNQATAVVQGFGNVGSIAAHFLKKLGVKVIAVSDRTGAIRNDHGIDVDKLSEYLYGSQTHGMVPDIHLFPGAEAMDPDDLLTLPCTVVVPAALEAVIDEENAPKLKCRVIAEGANGPTTPEADKIIADSDIFVIPDVLCNAGGVTVSYFEWVQDIQQLRWTEKQVNELLEGLILDAFNRVRKVCKDNAHKRVSMRTSALSVGVRKVAKEKEHRGLFP